MKESTGVLRTNTERAVADSRMPERIVKQGVVPSAVKMRVNGRRTSPCNRAQYVAVQKRPTDAAKVVRGAGKKCVLGMHNDCGNRPGGRDTILEYPQVII